jgi:uncharacterized protein YPO0396
MLEPHDTASYLDGIVKHFEDLDHIHRDLIETKRQIDLLLPIEKHYTEYKKAADEVNRLGNVKRSATVILNDEAGRVMDAEIERIDRECNGHKAEAERLEGVVSLIDQRVLSINLSLRSNKAYNAIEELKKEEERLSKELTVARSLLKDLREWLVALQYKDPLNTEADFKRLRKAASQMESNYATRQAELLEQRGATRSEIARLRERADTISTDIKEMMTKRTKIPREFRAMREEICRELNLSEGQLPFVGELIDVIPAEESWRHTIEVLLNNFALSVVVPEGDIHRQVTGYVEHSKFRRRFVYFAAPRGTGATVSWVNSYVHAKLVLREDAWCRGWLLQKLLEDFNYKCCETDEEFKSARGRAVTRNKHIRSGDRSLRESDYRNWQDFDILGWSNEAKIRQLQSEVQAIQRDIQTKESDAANMQKEASGFAGGLILVRKLIEIPSYRAIDESTISLELTTATDRRRELEENDDEIKALNASLKEATDELAAVRNLLESERVAEAVKRDRIKEHKTRRGDYGDCFNKAAEEFDWREWESTVKEFRGDKPLAFIGMDGQIERLLGQLGELIDEQKSGRDATERLLIPKQQAFLDGTKTQGYGTEWTATVASAPGMVELLRKLRDEKYFQLEGEFKHQMHLVLEEDIEFAKTDLRTKHNDNATRISLLNQTLRTVVFDDLRNTYVQIVTRPSADQAVVIFRDHLTECTRHVIAMTEEQRMERFEAIRKFIDYIKSHRPDAEKGANPNNWDTFSLSERKNDTDVEVNFYGGSTGKSGGQKAKLACTIVAVAMAFRMNHTRVQNSNAFRLIMIDEIFAKSDDVNSAFALRIFEQFDFQLLLVTPRDGRLKLVIPYVESFHLFQNPTEADSLVSSITAARAEEIATN